MSVKYVTVRYTRLYLACVPPYLHQHVFLSLLLRWKVRKQREAFVCRHNHGRDQLRPFDAFSLFFSFFSWFFPKGWDRNGWHFLQRQHFQHPNTHKYTHTNKCTHCHFSQRDTKEIKGKWTQERETRIILAKRRSECVTAEMVCADAGQVLQRTSLQIQKQLLHTCTVGFDIISLYYKNTQDTIF